MATIASAGAVTVSPDTWVHQRVVELASNNPFRHVKGLHADVVELHVVHYVLGLSCPIGSIPCVLISVLARADVVCHLVHQLCFGET